MPERLRVTTEADGSMKISVRIGREGSAFVSSNGGVNTDIDDCLECYFGDRSLPLEIGCRFGFSCPGVGWYDLVKENAGA